MSSSTPSSSTARPDRKDAHPYAIKTTQAGILARSNSSKAHGSWARHRYTPSSAKMLFNPPEADVTPTRDPVLLRQHSPSNTSQKADNAFSNSPSSSKSSKTWTVYTAEGVDVQLPGHPYLWTPSQLSIYLSASLKDKNGDFLNPDDAERILNFISEQRIGGRIFLSLDEEDFQELDGLSWDDNNALWDAACLLRQQTLPYRASRISSTSYKRGRVKGIISVFEKSASENSDIGEDNTKRRASPSKQMNGHLFEPKENGGKPLRLKNMFWDMSESESDAERIVWNLQRRNTEEATRTEKRGDPEKAHFLNGGLQTTVISPPAEIPTDAVVAPPSEHMFDDISSNHHPTPDVEVAETKDEGDSETHISREVDINSIPARHDDEELTMSELYERVYGEPAPSSRTVPVEVHLTGTTMRMPVPSVAQTPSRPPTALRPVRGKERRTDREGQPVPGAPLGHLFIPNSIEPLQNIFLCPPESVASAPAESASPKHGEQQHEADLQTIAMLRARLAHVEQRLAEVERTESERSQGRSLVRTGTSRKKQKNKQPREQVLFDDDLDLEFHQRCSRPMRIARDIFYDGDGDLGTTFRTWQSTCILLAGATTGVSIILLPLLRHLWTK